MIDLMDSQGGKTASFTRPGAWQQGLSGSTASYGYGQISGGGGVQPSINPNLQSAQFQRAGSAPTSSVASSHSYGQSMLNNFTPPKTEPETP